eukprot:766232-Hanusia_phi.AAC.2
MPLFLLLLLSRSSALTPRSPNPPLLSSPLPSPPLLSSLPHARSGRAQVCTRGATEGHRAVGAGAGGSSRVAAEAPSHGGRTRSDCTWLQVR